MDHALEHTVLKPLMEVADLPQLFANPALLYATLITGKLVDAEVAIHERFICGFGGKHSTLDGEVNSF